MKGAADDIKTQVKESQKNEDVGHHIDLTTIDDLKKLNWLRAIVNCGSDQKIVIDTQKQSQLRRYTLH
ncbi:hypothetical protein DFR44_13811 [Hydromonas duriensis]|uniref:Uncharacterized protein n=1 Tax=Hydromonas duriensis TaxID=1527608 RepID=A0A4R6Y058_9BURK|nr:hypothetical protein DFR44_13811 [Hydromonas duriensis]